MPEGTRYECIKQFGSHYLAAATSAGLDVINLKNMQSIYKVDGVKPFLNMIIVSPPKLDYRNFYTTAAGAGEGGIFASCIGYISKNLFKCTLLTCDVREVKPVSLGEAADHKEPQGPQDDVPLTPLQRAKLRIAQAKAEKAKIEGSASEPICMTGSIMNMTECKFEKDSRECHYLAWSRTEEDGVIQIAKLIME